MELGVSAGEVGGGEIFGCGQGLTIDPRQLAQGTNGRASILVASQAKLHLNGCLIGPFQSADQVAAASLGNLVSVQQGL